MSHFAVMDLTRPKRPTPRPGRRGADRQARWGWLGLVLVALVVPWLLSAAGCGQGQADEYTPDGRLVVTYWEKWSGFEGDAMQAVVDEFNASQDEYFVRRIATSEIDKKMMLATSGGNPPDVCGLWSWAVVPLAEKNALTPLDGYMAQAGVVREDFIPVFWDMCSHRGYLWAMPTTPASLALHYNVKLLREAHAAAPEYFAEYGLSATTPPPDIERFERLVDILTIVEISRGGEKVQVRYPFLTDAEKRAKNFSIVQLGHTPYDPGWYRPILWMWFGGSVWDGDRTITATDPGIVAALEWVASYPERFGADNLERFVSSLGEFGSAQNPFMAQRVAMQLQGVWMYNFIDQYAPHLEWDVVAFPSEDPSATPETSLAQCDVLVIPNGAAHPEAAAEFIAFVASQQGQELLNMGQRKFSARVEVSPEFVRDHPNPHIETFIRLATSPHAQPEPPMGIWRQYDEELRVACDTLYRAEDDVRRTALDVLEEVQPRLQWKLDREVRRWDRVGEARLDEWEAYMR